MTAAKLQHNYIRYVIIIFVAIMAIGLTGSIFSGHTSGDFDVYYQSSLNYLAHTPIYIAHSGIEEFKYSPLFAWFFSFFTIFEKTTSMYLWSILNIFLLFSMFYFIFKLRQISFNSIKDFLIIFFLFALTGRYIFSNIKIGQVNILLCFLLVLTMYFDIKKKCLWAAACLALSLMIKLFPLLFLAYFILRRKFKIAGFTVLVTAALLLLPAAYSGFSLNLKYLHEWVVLLKTTPATMLYSVKNYSLFAFFAWLFISRHEPQFILNYRFITKGLTSEVYYAWAASCFAFFGLFFYDAIFKKERDERIVYLDYSCLFVCVLLFNPLAYLNALVLLVVPYFFILRYLFYLDLGKLWVRVITSLTVVSFISSMAYNKAFFKDIEQFYASLVYRFPMWTIILVYLCLWLVKFSLKLKLKRQAAG